MTKTFEDLLDELSPAVRQEFQRAMSDVTDRAVLRQVEDAIRRGDINGAFLALGYERTVLNRFLTSLATVFETGGAFIMGTFPSYLINRDSGLKVPLRFNVRDRRAEEWLRIKSSEFVTGISNDVREAVRETASAGIQAGRNPRQTALDIIGRYDSTTKSRVGGVVGLGAREREWARSAEQKIRSLDKSYLDMGLRYKASDLTFIKAIETGRPLNEAQISTMMTRYRANALRYRGETIARTETLAALNRSDYEATLQAVATGNIRRSQVKRVWDATMDRDTRPSHRDLDETSVGIDEPWVTKDGQRLMHPGDTSLGASGKETINCRCRVRLDVDWFAGVK